MGNRMQTTESTIEGDTVASGIRDLIQQSGTWEGTMSSLQETLRRFLPNPEHPPLDYPKTVQAMVAHIRRIAPALREIGIERIDLPRSDNKGSRRFRLTSISGASSDASVGQPSIKT